MKKTEKKFQGTKLEWEEIFQAIGHPTFILTPDHGVVAANKAAINITGFSVDEMIGKQCHEIMHGLDHPPECCPLEKMCSSLKFETAEMEIETAGGTFLVSCTPVLDKNNNLEQVIHIATDISKRMQAEKALLESEKRYKIASQAGQVGVWDWNLETNDIYVDPNLKSILGYKDDEIKNHLDDWGKHVHPDDGEIVMEKANAHLEGLTPQYEVVHRMLHKDGSIRWFLARGTAYRDKNGKAYRVVGTDTDITERKEMEHQLLMINEAISKSLNGFDIVDEQGNFIYVNQAYLDMWGYESEKEVIGTSHVSHCADEKVPSQIIAALKKDGKIEIEFKAKRKDGSTFDVLMNAFTVKNEDGSKLYAGSSLDITERKRAEDALSESEEKFRNIVEQSADGISVANEDGVVIEWNHSLQKITGLKSKDVLGEHIWDVQFRMNPKEQQTKEMYELLKENLNKFLKIGNMPFAGKQMVRKYTHPDGSTKFIQGSVFPIKTKKGFMLSSISRDVTESNRAENLIKESEQKFRTLVANIPGATYRCEYEPNWTMQYLSDKIEELTGYPASDFLNNKVRTYASIIHPDDKKMVEDVVFGAVDKKKPFSIEYRILHASGEERWIFENGQGVFDEKNEILYLDGVFFDATERKLAEEKIKTSEANLKSLIDNWEDYIWSLDRDYRYITFNSTYAKMFYDQYKAELKTCLNSLDYLSDDEKEFWVGVCEQAFKGENVKFEYSYDLGRGMQHFQTSINPILKEGKITGISLISSDITENVKSAERFKALFEHSPAPLWEEDFSGA